MVEPPRVAVMILNYNGLRWLPNSLSSVAKTDYPNLDAYLEDNWTLDMSAAVVLRVKVFTLVTGFMTLYLAFSVFVEVDHTSPLLNLRPQRS